MRRLFASRLGIPIALLAGLAMPLGFAPFGMGVLPVLGLALVFAVVAAGGKRRPCLAAYLYGLGYTGFGVYWIFISISEYGGGWLAGAVVTPLIVLLLALYPLLALWAGARLARGREGLACLLALPVAWVAVEWLRSWLFTGATWLAVGYSQIDTPLAALAPLFGYLGISLGVAILAGLLAWWFLEPLSRRVVVVPIALALYALPAWTGQPGSTSPVGESVPVALVQGNIPQQRKWQPGARRETMRMYMQATRERFGTPLVVWPETAVPAFYQQVRDQWLRPFAKEAAAAGTQVVTGVPAADLSRDRAYNAVTVLGSSRFYYKRHLVPFGEYVPFRDWLGGALDFVGAPLGDFNAGSEATLLHAAGLRLGASICYEVTFASEIADALPAAEVLINVSNDAWFQDSLAPYQHLEMARMRALEMGRPMLRATNTGISAIIDASGEVLAQTPLFERTVLEGEIRAHHGATWYTVWENWPVAGASFAGLFVAGGLGRERRSVQAPQRSPTSPSARDVG